MNRKELRLMIKEKGCSASKDYLDDIDKELKIVVEDIINKSVMIARHTNRKTLKSQDLRLLKLLK